MNLEEKLELIERNTEEILTKKDLIKLLENNTPLKHYIGFEISGKIHLGTGLICMSKVKDFQDAGIDVNIFLADWHTWINDKLKGNRKIIKEVAVGYFTEGLKACFKAVGGDPNKLNFVLGSDLYHNNDRFWETVIDVSKNTSLSRIQRSITILGRKEGGNVDFAKLIYPPMQIADIFTQNINISHSGIDQRKAHVVARDVALSLKENFLVDSEGKKIKPIAIHHSLILGLLKPPKWPIEKDEIKDLLSTMKMSKSNPASAVFITDSKETIEKKINKAFCPEGNIDFNPIINWCEQIIFRSPNSELVVERDDRFGGTIIFRNINDLKDDFKNKKLHPIDLKKAVSKKLIEILEPIRKHFEKPENKKLLEELDKILKK